MEDVMGPVSYRIKMLPSIKRAHNVFHVSKLNPYKEQVDDPGNLYILIDVDGNVEQEVSKILDKKREERRIK